MLKKLCLLSVILINSACVTIHDHHYCAVAGVLSAGGICGHTISDQTEDMTFDEFLDFLEARPERPDPKDPTKTLPAHAAAIAMAATDWNDMKTELEQACREMGSHCSYTQKQMIQNIGRMLEVTHFQMTARQDSP